MSECNHIWIANSGKGGEPQFKKNSQIGSIPTMHVKCSDCGCRTWLSQAAWTVQMVDEINALFKKHTIPMPLCPKCNHKQVQLVTYGNVSGDWKCRHCAHKWVKNICK